MKSFSVGIGSVLGVMEKDNRNILLVVSDDGDYMREATKKEFVECFKSLAFICITSRDKELINKYQEYYQYLHSINVM